MRRESWGTNSLPGRRCIPDARRVFDDPVERRACFAEEIRRMDQQSMIEVNRREAREEGLAEGEAMGLAKGQAQGLADLLELDLKEVRRLAAKFGLVH